MPLQYINYGKIKVEKVLEKVNSILKRLNLVCHDKNGILFQLHA